MFTNTMKKLSDEVKFHKTDHEHMVLTLSLAHDKQSICGDCFHCHCYKVCRNFLFQDRKTGDTVKAHILFES